MKRDRNYGLDILRVIAIISVLSVHFFFKYEVLYSFKEWYWNESTICN